MCTIQHFGNPVELKHLLKIMFSNAENKTPSGTNYI
jgi:hypothetical protein